MKPTKVIIAACAVLGILATFVLPYISVEGMSMKFWDFHSMPGGLSEGILNGPKQVYVALVGFGLAFAVGMQALAAKRLARGVAIVSAVGFLLAFATEGVRKGLLGGDGIGTAMGGKLLFLSAVVGLVASIVGVVKAEQA